MSASIAIWTLFVYTSAEHGDRVLMHKHPVKFANGLRAFLER